MDWRYCTGARPAPVGWHIADVIASQWVAYVDAALGIALNRTHRVPVMGGLYRLPPDVAYRVFIKGIGA